MRIREPVVQLAVSTTCLADLSLHELVVAVSRAGGDSIELSGAVQVKTGNLDELLVDLEERYGISFICHNYFPVPAEPLVLNMASLDDAIYRKTIDHYRNALDLSMRVGSSRFGLHAGYRLDIPVSQIGRLITRKPLYDRDRSLARFVEGIMELQQHAAGITIYVENNVISRRNFDEFGHDNPFFCTDADGVEALMDNVDCCFLLDLGHLKVSAATLGLSFSDQLSRLCPLSDYWHLSDNDAVEDANWPVSADSDLFLQLLEYKGKARVLTLETFLHSRAELAEQVALGKKLS